MKMFFIDERIRPVPALARWEQLGPRHYRFYLKPGRPAFHDGTPLRAHDVAATYRSILAPDSGSPHAGTLRLITDIEVLDDDTLDFRLSRPDPLLPGYLVIGILPAAGIANGVPFHAQPLGSGPFRLAGWPEPGRLQLTRIADGQAFEFLRIGDPTVRVLKLRRGEVDILQNDLLHLYAQLVLIAERLKLLLNQHDPATIPAVDQRSDERAEDNVGQHTDQGGGRQHSG